MFPVLMFSCRKSHSFCVSVCEWCACADADARLGSAEIGTASLSDTTPSLLGFPRSCVVDIRTCVLCVDRTNMHNIVNIALIHPLYSHQTPLIKQMASSFLLEWRWMAMCQANKVPVAFTTSPVWVKPPKGVTKAHNTHIDTRY